MLSWVSPFKGRVSPFLHKMVFTRGLQNKSPFSGKIITSFKIDRMTLGKLGKARGIILTPRESKHDISRQHDKDEVGLDVIFTLADPGGGGGPPRPWPPPNAKLARPNYVLASPKPASGFT